MQPTIAFHGIASIELSAIRTGQTDSGQYAVRDLTLTDKDGKRFEVRLFNDTGDANALAVRDLDFADNTPPTCRHGDRLTSEDHLLESQGKGLDRRKAGPAGKTVHTASPAVDAEGGVPEGGAGSTPASGATSSWQPPPSPRPHAFPEHGGNCTRCGATPQGPLSKLVCGKGYNNLSAKDRAVAADARA